MIDVAQWIMIAILFAMTAELKSNVVQLAKSNASLRRRLADKGVLPWRGE